MITLAPSTCSRLVCSIVSTGEQLEQLVPEWLALLQRSASNEPVLSPIWMLHWWRIFGSSDGRQLCVACFFRDGLLVGLAPLLRRRYWHRPGIPFRRLELLSTGEREEEAISPDYLNILAERSAEHEVAKALVERLVQGALGPWDELVLPHMDGDSPSVVALTEAFRAAGLLCDRQVTASASYIPLPGSWEEYLQALSSSSRYYVRQSLRRFDRWANDESQLHQVRDSTELKEGQRILTALHQGRWGEKTGKFGSPHFAAFHAAVMPALLQEGALELLWLTVRGEPVAAVYNLVWNGKVHFYQSGRKIDVPSGIRPGIVLHAYAIRRAIEAGRREYDFLGGGEHYKGQMALASRPLVQLRVARLSLRERARVMAERGIQWARVIRKTIRGQQSPVQSDDASILVGENGERP